MAKFYLGNDVSVECKHTEKGAIAVIQSRYSFGGIALLGSSAPASVEQRGIKHPYQSFALSMKKGEIPVVAITTIHRERKDEYDTFLSMAWEEEKLIVDLGRPGIPFRSDRLGQIVRYSDRKRAIEVRIGAEVFTTLPNIPGKRYVADPDLLCRYIDPAGTTTAEEVVAAAAEAEEELSVREELAKTQEELAKVQKELTRAEGNYWEMAKHLEKDGELREKMDSALNCAWILRSTRWERTWRILQAIFPNKYKDVITILDTLDPSRIPNRK